MTVLVFAANMILMGQPKKITAEDKTILKTFSLSLGLVIVLILLRVFVQGVPLKFALIFPIICGGFTYGVARAIQKREWKTLIGLGLVVFWLAAMVYNKFHPH